MNYLRLVVECQDYNRYKDEVGKIYKSCYELSNQKGSGANTMDELQVNRMEKNTYYTLAFLDGKFRDVVNEGMAVKEALGWSYTFMKQGIALFLLYLYQGEQLPIGCKNMCNMVVEGIDFSAEKYSRGLVHTVDKDNASLFWDYFCKWRSLTHMQETDVQWIMEKLDAWIRLRVEGIMKSNHRKYYGECAAFIAAYGEVEESRGEMFGKERLMEAYKADYSRRTAFHQELRMFGMRDSRRR